MDTGLDRLHSADLCSLGISFWAHEDGSISYFLPDGSFVYLTSNHVDYLYRYFHGGRWWDAELCAVLVDLILNTFVSRWRDASVSDCADMLSCVRLLVCVYQRS